MQTTVFVPGWEMHCCGVPFQLGSTVTWDVVESDGGSWLQDLLPTELRRGFNYRYGQHGLAGIPLALVAVVEGIEALFYDYEPDDGGPANLRPVSGSATVTAISSANGRESVQTDPMKCFSGYLVTANVLSVAPDADDPAVTN